MIYHGLQYRLQERNSISSTASSFLCLVRNLLIESGDGVLLEFDWNEMGFYSQGRYKRRESEKEQLEGFKQMRSHMTMHSLVSALPPRWQSQQLSQVLLYAAFYFHPSITPIMLLPLAIAYSDSKTLTRKLSDRLHTILKS